MELALAFYPAGYWQTPDTCDIFLPLHGQAFLAGDRATSRVDLWNTITTADTPPRYFLRSAPERSSLLQDVKFQPGNSRLLSITTNIGRNRVYLLYQTKQVGTDLPSMQILRFNYDSHKNKLLDFYGELPIPLPQTSEVSEFIGQSYSEFISFLSTNPEVGGYRGRIPTATLFDKYNFMYIHDEYLYVIYPLTHPNIVLNNIPAVHQVMSVFNERTGEYLGTYLLGYPHGLGEAETAPILPLRTGVFMLDQHLIFCNEAVNIDTVGVPYKKAPSLYRIKSINSDYAEHFLPPARFFTFIAPIDIPQGYSWARPFHCELLFDTYRKQSVGSSTFSILGETEFNHVEADKDQLFLYGFSKNVVQQYAIDYIEWELLQLDGSWHPMNNLNIVPWEQGRIYPFRIRNRARATQLLAIQLTGVDTKFHFSLDGVNPTKSIIILKLNPQHTSNNLYLHSFSTSDDVVNPLMQTMQVNYTLNTRFDEED